MSTRSILGNVSIARKLYQAVDEEALRSENAPSSRMVKLINVIAEWSEIGKRSLETISANKHKMFPVLAICRKTLTALEELSASYRGIVSKYDNNNDVYKRFLNLQDSLIALARKFERVRARKYFVNAYYGKKLQVLHVTLSDNMDNAFNYLDKLETKARLRAPPPPKPKPSGKELYDSAMALKTKNMGAKKTFQVVELFTEAAAAGYPLALVELGRLHEVGSRHIPADHLVALQFYLSGAATQDVECITELGKYYVRYAAANKNDAKKYRELVEQAKHQFFHAAESGNSEAECCLGEMYFAEGKTGKARWYFERAANNQHQRAQNNLAVMAAKTCPEAVKPMLEKSVKQGCEGAAENLSFYTSVKGKVSFANAEMTPAEKALRRAITMFERSIGKTDITSTSELTQAWDLFSYASMHGETRAYYYLGIYQECGLGDTVKDYEIAQRYYEKVIQTKGISREWRVEAAYRLGEILCKQSEYTKAATMYRVCLKYHHPKAHVALQMMIDNGYVSSNERAMIIVD